MALDQILRVRRAAESYADLVAAKNASLQQAAGLLGVTIDSIDEGIVVLSRDGEIRIGTRLTSGCGTFRRAFSRSG